MSELKTLKDLKWDDSGNRIFTDASIRKLKAEIIKWVKELEELGTLGDLDSIDRHNANMGRKAQVEFIKYFFNLTKEDLK